MASARVCEKVGHGGAKVKSREAGDTKRQGPLPLGAGPTWQKSGSADLPVADPPVADQPNRLKMRTRGADTRSGHEEESFHIRHELQKKARAAAGTAGGAAGSSGRGGGVARLGSGAK